MTGTTAHPPSLLESDVLRATEVAPGYLDVTFDNPPVNLFGPEVFAGLSLLREYVEDPGNDVRVVVFESAHPDFFFAHVDFPRLAEVPDIPGARSLIEHWPHFSHWLTTSPTVSISKIRGRTRGIGNEFALATDMRFASAEKAVFCQIEVGFGMAPGGGAVEWLPQLVGRARALEIVLSAEDVDAPTAELYGLVNRSVPDARLDDHVDRLARRIASYSPRALATAKEQIAKRRQVPTVEELKESFSVILELAATDESKAISAGVRQKAGGSLGPAELDLPDWYGPEGR